MEVLAQLCEVWRRESAVADEGIQLLQLFLGACSTLGPATPVAQEQEHGSFRICLKLVTLQQLQHCSVWEGEEPIQQGSVCCDGRGTAKGE